MSQPQLGPMTKVKGQKPATVQTTPDKTAKPRANPRTQKHKAEINADPEPSWNHPELSRNHPETVPEAP